MLLNKFLFTALLAVVAQQLFLGLSTYSIADAGKSLGEGDIVAVAPLIMRFFAFSLCGFLTSIIAGYFEVVACRSSVNSYLNELLKLADTRPLTGSDANKRKTSSWLSGEAIGTISELTSFILSSTSTLLNVTFTLGVFYIVLGPEYGTYIATSIVVSILLIYAFRSNIGAIGGDMQRRLLSLNSGFPRLWDAIFSGSIEIRVSAEAENRSRFDKYFDLRIIYTIVEQALAAIPILIAVATITWFLYNENSLRAEDAGVLVAVLPRSLQLLGNAHALAVTATRYYYYHEKRLRLHSFWSELYELNWKALISSEMITLRNNKSGDTLEVCELLSGKCNLPESGRYSVSGPNGSGKSTLLRLLKAKNEKAVYIGPNVSFLDHDGLSTGQELLVNLKISITCNASLLLLDEWNANLDADTRRDFDKIIDTVSKKALVLEVRHYDH